MRDIDFRNRDVVRFDLNKGVRSEAAALVDGLLSSPEFETLVEMCGGQVRDSGSTSTDRLKRLVEFSARWDARRGRNERGDHPETSVPYELEAPTYRAALALGLMSEGIPRGSYDHALVLGGSAAPASRAPHIFVIECLITQSRLNK